MLFLLYSHLCSRSIAYSLITAGLIFFTPIAPPAEAAPASCVPFDYQLVMQAKGQVTAANATDFEKNSCALQLIQIHHQIWGNEYTAEDLVVSLQGLLANGADLKRANKQAQTPLHIAVEGTEQGQFSLPLISLLAAHAPVQARDQQGNTPLLVFLSKLSPVVGMQQSGDFLAIAQKLTTPATINQANQARQTPLMLAAESGYPEIVQYLLQQGAQVNFKDKQGRNALDYAAAGFALEDLGKEHGKFCAARLLIQAKSTIRKGILNGWQDRINQKCLS